MMIYTTLNKIREYGPCEWGWKKLLAHLGKTQADDEPLPFATIVKSNGIGDALWCCRSAPEHDREWRLFAVWCGRQVQHLMSDPRSIDALDVAERYANGAATDGELSAARAAGDAAMAARDAAWDAGDAAWDALAAAWDTAMAARYAAMAAQYAALIVVDAAWDAARAAQKAEFLRVVGSTKIQNFV